MQTLKFRAADGALIWSNLYARPGSAFDSGNGIAVDASDNVVVAGQSAENGSRPDFYTVKYSPDGSILWQREYAGPRSSDEDIARAVAIYDNGDVS